MKLKVKPLSQAVSVACAAAGSFVLYPAVPAMGQEAGLEEVIVTGSRIRRAVSDAPSPLSVMNRLEIDLTGLENVADVLRGTNFNSFGSFRERSGSSFGQVALVSLRGLGSDRTAVLVNGRRVPGNPFTGTAAVDLNAIPLAAIDRVEVLTDSASAVYGADAIGGVVNVILRDDYDGAELEIGFESPSRAGADSDHASFVIGTSSDTGSVLFTAELFERDPIFDGDRDYSAVQINGPNLGDTIGVSAGGNTAFHPWFLRATALGDCPTDVYAGVLGNPFGVPGTACGFGYADISAQTGGLDRVSTFLDANYEFSPGHEVFFENRYTRIESFGRYAPAVGFFSVPADSPYNPFDTSGESYPWPMQADGTPGPFSIFHRFVGHGPRDDDTVRFELDSVLGVTGSFGESDINYEGYLRSYRYDGAEEGETYILQSQVELEVEQGDYNLTNPLSQDPAHLAALGRMAATLYRDIVTDYTAAGFSLDGSAWDLRNGPIGWAVGAETASEDYLDDYDAFREAGNILGSAGNSSAGDRSRWAVFGELSIPVAEAVDLNVAGRYDDYDDFGTAFSPQISARWQVSDPVVLRASWGEGFKAPNLTELYVSRSQSFNDVQDVYRCEAIGIAEDDCPQNQVENFRSGNPDLEAETAESFNLGVVIEPTDGLQISLDRFSIEMEDGVDLLGFETIIELENRSQLPDGIVIERGASTQAGDPGALVSITRPFTNQALLTVEGYDLRANYERSFSGGSSLFADLELTYLTKFEEIPSAADDPIRYIEDEATGSPAERAVGTLRWSRDVWTANLIWRYIGSHDEGDYEAQSTFDLTVVWDTPWGGGDISAGVRNLTDEDPVIDRISGYDSDFVLLLYDVAGRTPFLTYRHEF